MKGGKMNKVLSGVLGWMAGAIVGTAIGLLLAPSSGRQLRADIQGYTDQVRREIELAAEERRQELEEQLARLRGEIKSE
jgi:gas vesicle protein